MYLGSQPDNVSLKFKKSSKSNLNSLEIASILNSLIMRQLHRQSEVRHLSKFSIFVDSLHVIFL